MAEWGGLWGSQLWGETGDAVSHLVVSGLWGESQAAAIGLGPRRTVAADLLAVSGSAGVGRGAPWAIHPVRATLVADSAAPAVGLAFWHRVAAALAGASTAPAVNLSMSHKLALDLLGVSGSAALAPRRHRIAAALLAESLAAATDLDLSHPIVATLLAASAAEGGYFVDIPDLPPVFLLNGGVIPNSFNLAGNGGAEEALTGWLPIGPATVTLVASPVWAGSGAVRVDAPAGTTAGVKVRSREGLGLQGRSGALVWAHGRIAVAAPLTMTTLVRLRYRDGYEIAWPSKDVAVDATGAGDDWDRVLAWPAEVEPGRVLDWAEVEFAVVNPAGGATFWVDGVQHEYDAWLVGPTAVAA